MEIERERHLQIDRENEVNGGREQHWFSVLSFVRYNTDGYAVDWQFHFLKNMYTYAFGCGEKEKQLFIYYKGEKE